MADGSSAADREIVITRLVDAPRDLVFKVCRPGARGSLVGPNGFTNTIHHMDLRPGGAARSFAG